MKVLSILVIWSIFILIYLPVYAGDNNVQFSDDSKARQENPFLKNKKNIVDSVSSLKKTNDDDLNLNSIDKIMSNQELLAYIQFYRNCEIQFSKISFINQYKEEFVKNRKLAKSKWNEFLNEKLENELASRYEGIITLTINTLTEKIKECQTRSIGINAELNEFERNHRKKHPKFKSLNLGFDSNKQNSLSSKSINSVDKQKQIYESPRPIALYKTKDKKSHQMTEKNIVYIKNNEKLDDIEPLTNLWKKIKDDLYLCNDQGNNPIKCLCEESANFKELEYMVADTLNFKPELENTIFYHTDDDGEKSNRFGIDILKIQLGHYKNYCG